MYCFVEVHGGPAGYVVLMEKLGYCSYSSKALTAYCVPRASEKLRSMSDALGSRFTTGLQQKVHAVPRDSKSPVP